MSLPPESFGRYELVEPLAQGGMAELWRAKLKGAAGFERGLVLKRVLPHLAGDRSYVDMFLREARLSSRLSHPNLVQVFELGEVDGVYYLTMEHVDGADLCDLVAARHHEPLPFGCAALIGREICRGLHYVHQLKDEQGRPLKMIHRDVSPSNIMLSAEGVVKLVDFGVAKAAASDERSAVHEIKGKLAYLAPEQITLRRADARSDLFAAGITLHELLTGRRLFRRDTDKETLKSVLSAPIRPPSLYNPAVPPELDAIVMRALERDPKLRYQSGEEMAEALDAIVHRTHAGAASVRAFLEARRALLTGRIDDAPTEVSAPVLDTLEAPVIVLEDSCPTPTEVVLPIERAARRRNPWGLPLLATGVSMIAVMIALSWPQPTPAPAPSRVEVAELAPLPLPAIELPSLPRLVPAPAFRAAKPARSRHGKHPVTLASAERPQLVASPSAPPLLPAPGEIVDPYR
jgi:serine/threonine protein kinase